MRVLISYLFCTKGGVETALYNRLKKIDRTNLEVDLHFFNDYGGMSLFRTYAGNVIIQQNEDLIQQKIEEMKYDVVISIDSPNMFRILQKMDYAGKIGLEVHTTYEKGMEYLDDRLIDIVDFIIVPSKYQKDLVINRIGKKKIYILGNAVSESIEYHKNIKKVQNQKKIILWVGRIDQHKNWRLFLKIASELYQRNKNYLFWVVGGLKSERSEINEFESIIYEYGLECVIRWIPQVPYEQIREIYSMVADSGGGYISTSTNESFGMTVIEAMACRCPVIVNKVGALPELVDDGRGLCLEDMGDSRQIDKIQAFLTEIAHTDMIERAYTYVKEHFGSLRIGRDFQLIIKQELYGGGYKKAIGIFGSCVSRDLFEGAGNNTFDIKWYFSRSSIISAVSEPIGYTGAINLSSEFQKRMVMCDLNKLYWTIMQRNVPDYILIDFIDERYEVAKIGNSYFTLSDEFKSGNCTVEYEEIKRVKKADQYFVDDVPLLTYLEKFINRITTVFPAHRIILHKAKMANYYKNISGGIIKFNEDYCKHNEQINDVLNVMYTYIEKKIAGCIVLECLEEYYADEQHKWGLMPMHYEEKYYKFIYHRLRNIVEDNMV